MLLIIADMDSIGEFQEELTYYDMESPCFQKSIDVYKRQETESL